MTRPAEVLFARTASLTSSQIAMLQQLWQIAGLPFVSGYGIAVLASPRPPIGHRAGGDRRYDGARCEKCDELFAVSKMGRPARYCDSACRQAAYRKRSVRN